jgi:hypothetical protein
VAYNGKSAGSLASLLFYFFSLLFLTVSPSLFFDTRDDISFSMDCPLRSITFDVGNLGYISRHDFMDWLVNHVYTNGLPQIRSLLISSSWSSESWSYFFQEYPSPAEDIELSEIGLFLKERSASVSGVEKSGVWIMDGVDSDTPLFEFPEENVKEMMRGVPRRYGSGSGEREETGPVESEGSESDESADDEGYGQSQIRYILSSNGSDPGSSI